MRRDRPRVVFDCVVFLQGAARATGACGACLKLVEDDAVELFLSAAVIAEIRDVLTRPSLQRKFPILTVEYVESLLQALMDKATVISHPPHLFTYDRDPKDEPYIDLAAAVYAEYLVSRDKDLLELPQNESFVDQFPKLHIVDPGAFLRSVRAMKYLVDQISEHLRQLYSLPVDTRIDISLVAEEWFDAVAVHADAVLATFTGVYRQSGATLLIAPMREPELSLPQLALYDSLMRDFARKLLKGEEKGLKQIILAQEGDLLELFDELGDRPNIAGSVKEGLLPVWHMLDHYLKARGYRAIKRMPHGRTRAAILAEKHSQLMV